MRTLRVQSVSLVLIGIMLVGFVPQAVMAAQSMQQDIDIFPEPFEGYDLEWIYIFYDPQDEIMSAIAHAVHEVVFFRINKVLLIPASDASTLEYWLLDEPWIAVYALVSNLEGVELQDRHLSWRQFYQILSEHRDTHHIVGLANTLSLEPFLTSLDSRLHLSEVEQTDGMLLILYDLWAIMEVVKMKAHMSREYSNAAEDLEKMVLQIYAENFNDFFKRAMEPVNPIGEVELEKAEARKAAMWARNPGSAQPAAYRVDEDGNLNELAIDELPEDFSPVIQLSSLAEVGAGSFIIGEIPLLSGLRGPIGEVVDVLLKVLTSGGSTVLSVPSSVLDSLKDIFEYIKPFLGIVQNFDAESPLKSIISLLVNEFPFPDSLKVYLEPLLKALFNLRGDLSSIISVVGELLTGLLPALIPEEVMTWLNGILDLGGDLWNLISDVVSGGKGAFDTILSFITTNILEGLLNKTLTATFGLNPSEIANLLNRGVAFIKSAVSYLASFDFAQFIQDVGQDLLTTALNILSDTAGQEILDNIMSVVQLGLGLVDLVDNFDAPSVLGLVTQISEEFIGADSITGDTQVFAKTTLSLVSNYSEQGISSVTQFESDLTAIFNTYLDSSVPASTREIVQKIILMIAGFFNSQFSPSSIPDLFDIAEDLVQTLGLSPSQFDEVMASINGALKPVVGIVAQVIGSDPLKRMVSQTVSGFAGELGDISSIIKNVIQFLDREGVLSSIANLDEVLQTLASIAGGVVNIIGLVKGQSFEGIMQILLTSVTSIVGIHPSFDNVPLSGMLNLMQSFFPSAFGLSPDELPSPIQVVNQVVALASSELGGVFDASMLETMLSFIFDVKGIFTDGVQWLLSKAYDWLTGQMIPLLQQLENMINGALGGLTDLVGAAGNLPIGLGEWSLFTLTYDLGIQANFHINPTPFFEFIRAILFEGTNPFSLSSVGDFFRVVLSFFEISPQFRAQLGVNNFDSSKNPLMEFLLGVLGVELSFSGSAKFVLTLFTFKEGMFQWEDFFKVVEWALSLKVAISRKITLLDMLTGGAGGGVLSKLGSYIGLDSISIDIWFSLQLDIVRKAATAIAAEVSTLTVILNLGAAINIGINIIVASASLYGSLEIILSFFQDLASASPMKITLRLILTLKLKIQFLFWDWKKTWTWEPGGPWDLSPKPGEPEYENSGIGFDTDGDGLSDEYEDSIPGLDKTKADTDGDGASDKLEIQTMGTDPTVADTDGDGLTDGEEWELGTNPLRADSDYDGLSDYDEVRIYGTNPLMQDTDGDGLSDYYEIHTKLSLEGITPTVTEVIIGGVSYNDRTDPLNPDTDGDGLLDGEEGVTGAYYGLDSLYNDTEGSGFDPDPLIFNGGYTHPLDADTDDDSYLQLYNGAIDKQAGDGINGYFLMDMNDGAEVNGFWIIVYDEDGDPERKKVYTNPCNPDTDGDTGVTDRTPQPGAWLNSDGYELAQSPPTDPTDGDSDNDGLIDGLEGVLNQNSYHTDPNNPDTDGDGLFDLLEILLGTDPRCADTDGDMISDGDEFYKFFTNPLIWDTDNDGLGDGEEVYFWHSNPLNRDSDGDGLTDGEEVLVYGSDPMDEDSDNDGLTDFEEVFIYYTNPFLYDTDGDGLSDGEEILIYDTNPLAWDTDFDSIMEPNEFGEMTWPMSDYHEVMIYHTNASAPDSDLDGLSDGLELYLGSGLIPWMDPLPLDPMNNDTDNDLLTDGSELFIANMSIIIYPFVGSYPIFRYNTSPVLRDTDGDNLIDFQEVCVFNTDPANVDTDNDTIDDWHEIWWYNTSALSADTDGDGLFDYEETLYNVTPYGPWPPTDWTIGMTSENEPTEGGTPGEFYMAEGGTPAQVPGIYPTSATNRDSDGDWLPDGAEVHFYGTDPMLKDTDGDGLDDTYEFDSDFDGLPDGLEFMLGLQTVLGGGIFNPDSDGDGLLDGDEYYIYGTDPANSDTDGDGYSDGLEIAVGTDPLTYTSKDEMELALAVARGKSTIRIMTPVASSDVYQDTQVAAANFTPFHEMWFRFENESGLSDDFSLAYNPNTQMWRSEGWRWAAGNYTLRVYGRNTTGVVHAQVISFRVISGLTPFPWWILGVVGAAAGVAIVSIIGYKKGWIRRPSRGKGEREPPYTDESGSEDVSTKKKSTKKSDSKKSDTKKSDKSGPSKGTKGGA